MAIAIDVSSTKIDNVFSATAVTETWSHTCTGSNLLLVVCVDIWQDVAGTGTVTAASYNSVAMTKVNNTRGNGMASEMWYLIAPATGAHTVSVTVTGATDAVKASATSWTGAAQSSVLDANNISSGISGNPTISLTTTTANCAVMATLSRFTTTAATTSATSIYNDVTGSTLGASSRQFSTTTGSYSDTYTGTSANDWSMVMASFKPFVAAGTTAHNLTMLGVGS